MKKHENPPVDMDALAAHLDRGWDLLAKNDYRSAEVSAQRALAAEPDAPEALTLLGAIAAAEGDEDDALEHYRKAMSVDPDFVAPMLYAAEILLAPERDPDEGLHLIDEALAHAEEEEEYLDALLLKCEALLSLGERDDEAKEALEELPPVSFPDASFHLRAARCFLDLSLLGPAQDHFEKSIALDANLSDAYHGLGIVHELGEDLRAMTKAWLKVRELDLEELAPPWSVSSEEFETLAEDALAELPARARKLLENVPILAAEYPSLEIVAEGNDPRMMGVFSGIPFPEKSQLDGPSPHLDCVFLYQRNIERMCRTREEVAEEIRITLLHETGHFFGLSEEDLRAVGLD
jgi:predicted Zn-dependent protease with MMP-like domain